MTEIATNKVALPVVMGGLAFTVECPWCNKFPKALDSDDVRLALAQHQVSAHRDKVFGGSP